MRPIFDEKQLKHSFNLIAVKKLSALREEVLNVKLAELLSRSGILSVPESIIRTGKKRRLPDVLIANYWGVRVILEGRTNDRANIKNTLESDCLKRIEEGLASLVIGVLYPVELKTTSWETLEQAFLSTIFSIKVFSEVEQGDWADSNLEGLAALLRRAYESLVKEDVVNAAVEELQESIEIATRDLAMSPGTAERLREILILPKGEESEQDI